jgi:hypothetical protein
MVNHIALQAPAIVSADQTITLPDQTGTVVTTGDNGSVSSTMLATNLTISAAAGSATTPSIAFTGDLNTGIYSPGADQLALSTAGNGRLFIDGNGLVGIGTVPAVGYGLDVRGLARLLNVGGASGLEIGTGTATNQFASLDLVGDATYVDYGLRLLRGNNGANAGSNIAHKGTGALSLITEEAAPIVLATSNAERLRIDSSGRVGIGTASPSQALQVNGNALIGATPATQYSNLVVAGDAALQAAAPLFNLVNAAGSARFAYIQHTGTGGDLYLLNQEAGAVRFGTNNTERLRIDSSGNVGIGTTSPNANLAIRSNRVVNTYALTIGTTNGASFENDVVFTFDGSTQSIGNFQNFPLAFLTNNTERLRIDSSGNVGIGTSSPTTLLDVNADTVRVRTARTPASASATGATGEICWDANYIYVCTATNTWKRSALSTW